ncbi:acetyl-CoA carboxylase biotin carboxyl carrier protein subunit [Marinoscillum furvescens]|nr:acetyl-CoA carboxylase biotin carboxyl carrier protein subunit [Marinoscillum furvescens]
MNLKISVNNDHLFEVKDRNGTLLVNESSIDYSLKQVAKDEFVLHYNQKAYQINVLNDAGAELELSINGAPVHLEIKDHITQILEELGMDVSEGAQVNEITAPMPGGIIDINVKAGDTVHEGDALLILEAMKMENIIKSPVAGTIAEVHVGKGDNVEKNQLLISF